MNMRLPTPEIQIGKIMIGGSNPIAIQSMTSTQTSDTKITAKQCIQLAKSGSEIIRIAVNNDFAAKAVPEIRKILDDQGYKNIPLIGDFHFNGHILLKEFPETAKTLDKYRINPGNALDMLTIIQLAKNYNKPIRIGINSGSLDLELLTKKMNTNAKLKKPKTNDDVMIDTVVESALNSAEFAEKNGIPQNKIVISVKMSNVQDVVKAYELLAQKMENNNHYYCLHIGLTEAGGGIQGTVSSSVALGILLQKGIGDTIRISVTPESDKKRYEEVEISKQILQSMNLRKFSPQIISCPGCGRTDTKFFHSLASDINKELKKKFIVWESKYPKIKQLKIAIMGCAVNGPGEARFSDISISLPGKMETKVAPVYVEGKFAKSLIGNNISTQFLYLIEEYLKRNPK